MNKITVHSGWKKLLTTIYWKLQFNSLFSRGHMLNIVETATLEIDEDSELGKLLKRDDE